MDTYPAWSADRSSWTTTPPLRPTRASEPSARRSCSPGAHPAVLAACEALHPLYGVHVTYLPVDAHGQVDPAALAAALTDDTALVSFTTHDITLAATRPADADGGPGSRVRGRSTSEAGLLPAGSGHTVHCGASLAAANPLRRRQPGARRRGDRVPPGTPAVWRDHQPARRAPRPLPVAVHDGRRGHAPPPATSTPTSATPPAGGPFPARPGEAGTPRPRRHGSGRQVTRPVRPSGWAARRAADRGPGASSPSVAVGDRLACAAAGGRLTDVDDQPDSLGRNEFRTSSAGADRPVAGTSRATAPTFCVNRQRLRGLWCHSDVMGSSASVTTHSSRSQSRASRGMWRTHAGQEQP